MLNFFTSIISLLLTSIGTDTQSETTSTIETVKKESAAFSQALQKEDIAKLLGYIDSNTMVLPEYHNALEQPSEIEAYYAEFFKLSETQNIQKEPFEIQQFGDYFQELGTFEHIYRIKDNDWFTYEGKYMTWWKKTANDGLKILAHIWGGNRWYEPEQLNFVKVTTRPTEPLVPRTPLEHQITENINTTTTVVKSGDVKKQVEGYLEDAIYMTYYDAPFKGKQAITDYFTAHNDPKVVRDSLVIRPYRVIPMGDYSLQLNKYYVRWTYEGITSFIRGKGLNFRKKMPNGGLKMYRQILNHDMPPTPVENQNQSRGQD